MQLLFMRWAWIFISLACLLLVVSIVVEKASKAKQAKADPKGVNEISKKKLS